MQDSNLPRRQYTEEFKIEAIRLAESIGGHEAARRLGVPVATVDNRKRRRAAAGLARVAAPEVVPSAAAVEFYNRVRMHTAIGFVAPVQKERSFLAS